jgi:hypothetical protein
MTERKLRKEYEIMMMPLHEDDELEWHDWALDEEEDHDGSN